MPKNDLMDEEDIRQPSRFSMPSRTSPSDMTVGIASGNLVQHIGQEFVKSRGIAYVNALGDQIARGVWIAVLREILHAEISNVIFPVKDAFKSYKLFLIRH